MKLITYFQNLFKPVKVAKSSHKIKFLTAFLYKFNLVVFDLQPVKSFVKILNKFQLVIIVMSLFRNETSCYICLAVCLASHLLLKIQKLLCIPQYVYVLVLVFQGLFFVVETHLLAAVNIFYQIVSFLVLILFKMPLSFYP